jgi:serine/threonine protein kinase
LRRRLSEKEQTADFLAADGLDVATIRAEIEELQREIAATEAACQPDQPISEDDWANLPSHERCASIQQLRQTITRVGTELGLRDLQVSRLVGRGANAAAYLARVNPDGRLGHNHANVLLAVKVIFNYHSVDTRTDATWIAKNKQEDVGEVRADIVPVLAIFDDNTDSLPDFRTEFPAAGCRHTTFLLQPFYSGGTLQGLIKRFNEGGGGGDGQALPRPVVQSYLQQMLDAVMRLQKLGLAHRDVKSDNILLTGPSLHGCPIDLALGDFGEVGPLRLEYLTDGTVSQGGAVVALCPEILAAIAAATRSGVRSAWLDYSKNDCWAVGVVACEMATGRMPWPGNSPCVQEDRRALPEHCGRTVRDVIDGLTRVDHDERLSADAAYHQMLRVFSED